MQKQTILITGTSSGFGRLLAEKLADTGHNVIATMRATGGKNKTAATELAGRPNTKVIELDVTSLSSVDEAFRTAGEVGVVINNAGMGAGLGAFCETLTDEQFKRSFEVNVTGVQRVMKAALPAMRKKGRGLIINVSSTMGRIVLPFAGLYTATKFALEGLTESYAYEMKPFGIDVTLLQPGGFGTEFWSNMAAPGDADRISGFGDKINLPEEMLWGGMGAAFEGDNAPDPMEIVKAVVGIIAAPAGERPLRRVVDPMTGGDVPRGINERTAELQNQLLTALGVESLACKNTQPA